MTQTKLLVITTQGYMAKDQKAEFTARAKDAADKVGAELLVLEPGQHANLFDGCVVPDKASSDDIKAGLRRCFVSRGAFLEPQIEGLTAAHTAELREELTVSFEDASILHVWDRDSTGRSRQFSKEAINAMRLLESLINAGDIELVADQWMKGRMMFKAAPLRACDKPAEPEEKVAAIQGEAMSFMLDPLEQAIESTVRMLYDEHQQMAGVGAKSDTALCDRLGSHLDALLAIQIERVTADEAL